MEKNDRPRLTVEIYERSEELPAMSSRHFFHSPEYFRILEKTRGQTPYMVVLLEDGRAVAHLLTTLRRRGSLIPPYLFTQGRVYGEGEYDEEANKEEYFRLMLGAITEKLRRKHCLYIEFSDLTQKMFGYGVFRRQGYFPIHWMTVYNSLHSKTPKERLTPKMARRIRHLETLDVQVKEVENYEEFRAFYRMLRRFFSLKVRRYLPPERLFFELRESRHAGLFVTKHGQHIIGGCVCAYHGDDAYLWYIASKRKTYAKLHPTTATVWGAICNAHQRRCRHIFFMDVGLPFRKTPYRDFILRFGGKEVGTYRWFRFSNNFLNRLLCWLYRE